MPSKWTFTIKPIKELVDSYVGDGKNWFDPFSGMYSPAEITNDLDSNCKAIYHMEARDFVDMLDGEFDGCIFDPPYGRSQAFKYYKKAGLKVPGKENPSGGFPKVKDRVAELIRPRGLVLYFGYNTTAMGKKRGFIKERILIVCHGGTRNDTLVTVERKVS